MNSHIPSKKKTFSSTSKDQQRLLGVALFLLVLFSLLIIQFFRIQIVQHEKWEKQAYAQHTVVVKEPFRRGVFYSNTSIKSAHPTAQQAFVIDVPKFHLYIDPKSIPAKDREEIASSLNQLLQLDDNEQKTYVRAQFEKESRSRKIAMWLSGEKKEEIQQWWQKVAKKNKIARNAIFFEKDYQRSYPFGKLLGHVLHTVRELRDEVTEQCIPTGGLEYVFDKYLQGRSGKRFFYRSPRHSMDVGTVIEAPLDGADVYLTINHCLQAIVEEEIEKQVQIAEAKRGWGIMLDPYTGEVLALAQYPFFYPSSYREYFNDEELLEETQVKALTDPYEPGSTVKMITMAICLMANEEMKKQGKPPIFDPMEKVSVLPTMFPGRSKPLRDLQAHRYVNMYMAIQKSSNVYMSAILHRVIEELGERWYRNILENVFGFGQKTGVELPGESPGLLPTPGKVHPNGTLEWSKPTPYSLAMGHNILANSFQIVRNFAIIANGGYDVKPTLVRKISRRMPDGSEQILLCNTFGEKKQRRLLDPEIVRQLTCALKYVTKIGGAARKADIHGYTEAGKTSTSEKIIDGKYSKKDHISTFIGFAPADHPRFVLMVVMDEPAYKYIPGIGGNQYGGNCAAPAFERIGRRCLEYLGVERDDPYGYPVGDPRRDRTKADWLKEVDALKKLYETWNR
ncbi:MAG: Stage V sporulation protein D [Chlamydiae bacterium]|nr:Stage V sporulation protein D [Chlamydiota bacterium]